MSRAPRARSPGPLVLRDIIPSIEACAPAPLISDGSGLIRAVYML